MTEIKTQSASRHVAVCEPIVLREGPRVRLAFVASIVDNQANPNSCIDGYFMYQRKATSGRWLPIRTTPLSTLREGDEFKLTLHAQELTNLLEGLVPLYRLHRDQGVPTGQKKFVEVDSNLAKFVSLGKQDLTQLLESHPEDATALLLKLVKWLATSSGRQEAATKLASMAPEQMPTFTSLLALVSLKDALAYWRKNQNNSSESFWQQSLSARSYVLSQVFTYPVVVIGTKVYVGGKQINNKGGKEVDFLLSTESTDAVILIEIKTPQTQLLGAEYRDGIFPLSRDLTAAVAQILRYRQSLMRKFDSITAENSRRLTLGEPRCVVVAGHSDELKDSELRENFELQRERIQGVIVVTYDELFLRLERLVRLLEEPL